MKITTIFLGLTTTSAFFTPPSTRLQGIRHDTLKTPSLTSLRPLTSHGGGINIGGGGGNGDGGNNFGSWWGSYGGSDEGKNENNNPFAIFWRGYGRLLEEQPLLTKALTSFFGFSLGDLLAQKFIDKNSDINWKRLLKLASFGFLIHGPSGHLYYGFLDGKLPGTSAGTVATKVAIDQLLWNPIFGVAFFSYCGLAEGQDFDGIKARVERDLFASVKGSWTVWPVAHAINFRFIPPSQRLLYINSIQIGYNMFLSFLANRGAATQESPIAAPKRK